MIVEYTAGHPDRPLKARALARTLNVDDAQYADFRAAVRSLLDDATLFLGPGRTLRLATDSGQFVGVFRANRRGFGFIERTGHVDAYVPRTRVGGALDGDTVLARPLRARRPQEGPAAEVVRVVERAPLRWVGVLECEMGRWSVQPRGRAPAPRVTIADPTAKGAVEGDLVVVEPAGEIGDRPTVRGVIVERLGAAGKATSMIQAVIRRAGLADAFTAQVRDAARAAAAGFPERVPKDRTDLTALLTITIDPVDARDFDDAISLESGRDGTTILGVHIADVVAFVREGDAIDIEARQRGTSVYFPRYVLPMLPETLSNEVCSLQPEAMRLTKSVFITFDRQARAVEARMCNSAIRSRARLTYEQASAVLYEGARDDRISAEVLDLLKRADRLARKIRERRLEAGAVVLAIPEVEIQVAPDGEVSGAAPADTSFSHTIIEMFMVEANEAVSRYLKSRDVPHLRRVHPPPEEDAGSSFARMIRALGYDVATPLDRASIRSVLAAAHGKPEEATVNYLLLRCLEQAYYGPEEIGHFALASGDYCHFTSPIRRYPDLVVHRQLDALLRGGDALIDDNALIELGRRCSAAERRALQAERDAKAMLLLEFMKSKIGESFDGIIIGAVSIGVFVQIQPYLAEGLVRTADFGARERWHYDEEHARFVGTQSGKVVTIGQRVRVTVAGVDDVRQELDLVPAERSGFGEVAVVRVEGRRERPGRRSGGRPEKRRKPPVRRGKRR